MADFFGYNKTAKGMENITSPSMVAVSIGGSGGALSLAQQCDVTYQREIAPVYELGSDSVWMTGGKSSGSCNISRAIGSAGGGAGTKFLNPFKPADPCKTTQITISKGAGTCGAEPGNLTCKGCLLQQIQVQVQVGQLFVTDSATFNVGSVEVV